MKKQMKMKKGGGKVLNKSIKLRGQWKAVDLDPSLFSEEGMEGLICFEEITNYRLVDSEKAASQAAKELNKEKKKKTAKKRKAGEVVVGEGVEEVSAPEPVKKKAKKKKKKKLVADKPEEATQEEVEQVKEDETEEEKDEVVQEVSSAEEKPSKKTKKQEQKKDNKAAEEECVVVPAPENTDNQPTKKKKPKNWTEAATSTSEDKNSDVSAWKNLFVPEQVLKALSSLGFSAPTPIQALVLPAAIRDRLDILGAAETGSGKTLAFGIPMIHSILEWKNSSGKRKKKGEEPRKVQSLYLPEEVEKEPQENQEETEEDEDGDDKEEEGEEEEEMEEDEEEEDDVDEDEELLFEKPVFGFEGGERVPCDNSRPLLGLVLTPTRELAVQVKHHIDAVAKFTGIRIANIVGGMAQQKQRRMLKKRPEIIIATPGRLWDLVKEQNPHLQNLRQLRCLVIDEADRMVERGHFAELESLLEMLNTTYFNPSRQTFVFSATLTMAPSLPNRILQRKKKPEQRDKVALLMDKVGIKSKPKIVDLTRKEATAETLLETQVLCQKEEKDFFLYYFLLQYPGRTMVFANSIEVIKRLNSLLVILDLDPLPLHANMHQKQRLKNLERFAERQSCVLLTTDVAARGLDIPNIQHVIHYHVPRTSETYVHRSGRTARATKEGLSLLMVGPDDMMNFKKIFRTLGKDEEFPLFPIEKKYMEAIKERVNLALQIEKIEYHNCKQKQHDSWFKQAAEALEVDLDEELLMGRSSTEGEDHRQQKMVKAMKKQLKSLTSQPVFRNFIKTKYPTQMGHLPLPEVFHNGVESAISKVSEQQQKHLLKKNAPVQPKKSRKDKRRQKKQQEQQ